MAAALLLPATVAWPQSANHGQAAVPSDHVHRGRTAQPAPGDQPMAKMRDMMARMADADARLETLVADMNMFTGDLKIETMARVLILLVERQSMMREHMMDMHDRMMRNMMGVMSDATSDSPRHATTDTLPSAITTDDIEPGTMCVEPTTRGGTPQ